MAVDSVVGQEWERLELIDYERSFEMTVVSKVMRPEEVGSSAKIKKATR